MKKRSFSLLEVVLSLGLFALLATTLFSWQHHLSSHKGKLEKLRWPLKEERYAHQRLRNIIPKITSDLPFHIEGGALIFAYDNGPALEPELSNTVMAKLYVQEDVLKMTIWPLPTREQRPRSPCQTLTLLTGVDDLKFKTYYAPDPFELTVSPEEVGETTEPLPAILKLEITRGKRECIFAFDLHHPILFA